MLILDKYLIALTDTEAKTPLVNYFVGTYDFFGTQEAIVFDHTNTEYEKSINNVLLDFFGYKSFDELINSDGEELLKYNTILSDYEDGMVIIGELLGH